MLTNSAGPLSGPPRGSALYDAVLPNLLDALAFPPYEHPRRPSGREDAALTGTYGPFALSAGADHVLTLDATAVGAR